MERVAEWGMAQLNGALTAGVLWPHVSIVMHRMVAMHCWHDWIDEARGLHFAGY